MKQSKFYEIFETKKNKKTVLLTRNLVPGKRVYGENLINEGKHEYREWNPFKSKPAAAIMKGLSQFGLKSSDIVLYLGSASGTTVSHFSDIVGRSGFIFALDFAPRVMRDLIFVCQDRKNIAPIFADANQPKTYIDKVCEVDFLFMDIAQKDQVKIFLKNVDMFLKKGGYCLLALKAKSIDVTKNSRDIFRQVRKQLDQKVVIVDYRELAPFERDHAFFVCKKKD
jgi:fibrillarin-like pre-rRNA processing protein